MKWFKHETDAEQSEKLSIIIEEFGFAGYGRFWRIMELVALKMDKSERHHIEYPIKKWGTLLQYQHKHLVTYMERLDNVGLMSVEHKGNAIKTSIPNLLKKRDNYTKDLQAADNKKTSKEVEVEVDLEVKPPLPPLNLKIENPEIKKLWADCLIQIKLEVLPAYFQNYFETARPCKLQDGNLTIAVPNQFVRKVMLEKFRDIIESTLKGIAGKQILIEFIISK